MTCWHQVKESFQLEFLEAVVLIRLNNRRISSFNYLYGWYYRYEAHPRARLCSGEFTSELNKVLYPLTLEFFHIASQLLC